MIKIKTNETHRFFIYAYPAMYGGLHGIHDWTIVECDYDEAIEYGYEMGHRVIESYGLEQEFYTEEDYYFDTGKIAEENEEEFYSCQEEIINEELDIEIYLVRDDVDTETIRKCNLGPASIIKEYCLPFDFE